MADRRFRVAPNADVNQIPVTLSFMSISAITQAASALVTFSSAHNLGVGDIIAFASVGGMVEINGLYGSVTVVNSSVQVTVSINTTGFTPYSGGGSGVKVGSSPAGFHVEVTYDDAIPKDVLMVCMQLAKERIALL